MNMAALSGKEWVEIIAGVLALLLILYYIIWKFNLFIYARNEVRRTVSVLDVALKRRCDLIPNLIHCVTGYTAYEKTLMERLTTLRTRAINPRVSLRERMDIDDEIKDTYRKWMWQMENYPDLKANNNFLHLQNVMNEVENQIAVARMSIAAAVTKYNNLVDMFPGNIVAALFGFRNYDWYSITDAERGYPTVEGRFRYE